jgi:hypothetical protein
MVMVRVREGWLLEREEHRTRKTPTSCNILLIITSLGPSISEYEYLRVPTEFTVATGKR